MAKVVQPLMSLEARGKMGGLIYNSWRSLSTVKAYRSPTQPDTPAQLQARALLTDVSRYWSSLSTAQRSAWAQYAEDHLDNDWTGQPLRLTAQNWFVRCGCRAALVGGSVLDIPPVAAAPAAPTDLDISFAAGPPSKIQMTWTDPVAATSHLVVYSAGPISAGRTPRPEQSAILAKVPANTASPYSLISTPAAGKYGFWVQVIDENSGLASSPLYKEVSVS